VIAYDSVELLRRGEAFYTPQRCHVTVRLRESSALA
jgi:hypothetical protein